MTAAPFNISRFKADTAVYALAGWDTQTPATSDWVAALRLRARNAVEEFGLPTSKLERWKFTNFAPRVKKIEGTYGKANIKIEGNKIYLDKDLSRAWVREILEAPPHGEKQYADMMVVHAANAFLDDVQIIDVPKNAVRPDPLVLTYTGEKKVHSVSHLVIRLAEGADFTLVEYMQGQGGGHNAVIHVVVGPNARLRHYRITTDTPESVSSCFVHTSIDRDGRYESFHLTQGGGMGRYQAQGELTGPNGHCDFSGLNLLDGKQVADTTLLVEHRAPHCQSNQYYKTIVSEEARGVFQGKIYVDQIAQKTDGYQLSNNILLSPLAEMNVKPELEIYADDVKCSHGSTTGALDETPLFYLRSRGLSEKEARRLLLEAFIGETLDKISHEAVQKEISERAYQWLNRL